MYQLFYCFSCKKHFTEKEIVSKVSVHISWTNDRNEQCEADCYGCPLCDQPLNLNVHIPSFDNMVITYSK